MRRDAAGACVSAAIILLTATGARAQAPVAAGQNELVYFKGYPAPVRVVRGGPAPAGIRPPAMARSATAAAPPSPATGVPDCRGNAGMSCANVQIVTFGDGRGKTVRVIRGPASSAATEAAAVPQLAGARPAAGRAEIVAFADPLLAPVTVVRGGLVPNPQIGLFAPAGDGELDRVAFAVEGVESGHGTNPRMWRPEESGPQGPMQVSAAAAFDAGGGDRFDVRQNRLLGRAFLAHMYQRYGNWPDALAAYNWGPGNLDRWIAAGRPETKLPLETARYIEMVLRDAVVGRVRM